MSYLLDTNVVSESMKPLPNRGVTAWLDEVDEDCTFLSVVTLTELRYGTDRLPTGRRRDRLNAWLALDLPLRFEGRLIVVDAAIAELCGNMIARSEAVGRRMEVMDAFIAATAELRGLTVVTRNASHFEPVLDSVLNPWS